MEKRQEINKGATSCFPQAVLADSYFESFYICHPFGPQTFIEHLVYAEWPEREKKKKKWKQIGKYTELRPGLMCSARG